MFLTLTADWLVFNQILRRAIEHVSACESDRCQQASRISPTGASEKPAGDRRQQSTRFSPAGDRRPQLSRYAPTGASEKPAGDRCQQASSYAATAAFNRWLCRRAMLQQQHSIDPQVDSIDGNSRRDFHPQVKSQQAIDASRRRAIDKLACRDMLHQEHLMHQQVHSIQFKLRPLHPLS